MRVVRLEVDGFRNLERQGIEPHPQVNVVVGDNAQGKTNLLEAIYAVGCLRSFRTSRSVEMISFGKERAVVRAEVETKGNRRGMELEVRAGGRVASIDGKEVRSGGDYLGKLAVVVFSPDDLRVPKGAPSERRKLLDQAILNVWPAYAVVVKDYVKALQSRNRVLSQGVRHGELLEVYDEQVADLGARVIAARRRYLAGAQRAFQEAFREVSRSGVEAEVVYLARRETMEAGEEIRRIADALRKQVSESRREDLARRTTKVGPQADDIGFKLGGRLAREHGSQGQVRSLMLAFKISQVVNCREVLGEYPVLLLDDVASELDRWRNEYLSSTIKEIRAQTFVTTTEAQGEDRGQKVMLFEAVRGRIGVRGGG